MCFGMVTKGAYNQALARAEEAERKASEAGATTEACRKTYESYKARTDQQLKEKNRESATLQRANIDLEEEINLMVQGPEPPEKSALRVLPAIILNQLLYEKLGDTYLECVQASRVVLSDGDWLVGSREDAVRYLEYFSDVWLPHFHYAILEWAREDGTQVRIWASDCDDITDLAVGIPAIHHPYWTALPWGTFWGRVQGIITGGHAFGFLILADENYHEADTKGLHLYVIEPQKGEGWTIPTPQGPIEKHKVASLMLREVQASCFEIKSLWLTKV